MPQLLDPKTPSCVTVRTPLKRRKGRGELPLHLGVPLTQVRVRVEMLEIIMEEIFLVACGGIRMIEIEIEIEMITQELVLLSRQYLANESTDLT